MSKEIIDKIELVQLGLRWEGQGGIYYVSSPFNLRETLHKITPIGRATPILSSCSELENSLKDNLEKYLEQAGAMQDLEQINKDKIYLGYLFGYQDKLELGLQKESPKTSESLFNIFIRPVQFFNLEKSL